MTKTILQPPALDHDAMMATRFGTKVSVDGKRERRIVWNLLNHVEAAGFKVVSVHDGEEDTLVDSPKAAMELIFNLDEAHVFVESPAGQHRIFLVLGNDIDILTDWTFSDGDGDGFNATMEKFDAEEYA